MSRRFSEEEAQRIFARAAERQRVTSASETGLSLADLEEAARAAGLDPALVAAAAAEVDAPASAPVRTLATAPVETLVTRIVPGTLTDDAWAEMVAAARAEFGQAGMAGQIGRFREWTAVSGGTKNGITTRLAAEPVPGGFRVTLSQSVRDMVFGFTIAAAIQALMTVVFAVVTISSGDPEFWIPTVIMAAFVLLFGGGTQVGTRLWHRRRTEQFDRLLDRFELIARAASDPQRAAPAAAPSAAASRLDLDALPDTADATDAARSNHRLRS